MPYNAKGICIQPALSVLHAELFIIGFLSILQIVQQFFSAIPNLLQYKKKDIYIFK